MFAGVETIAREPRTAFLSDDAIEILQFAAQSLEAGYATALVTLVEIHGGAARALGASWRLALGATVLAPPFIHLVFFKLLRVPLPDGILAMPW